MHFKRWLTGIVAVPPLIYLIGAGPRWLFQVLVLIVALRGLWECYRLTFPHIPNFIWWSSVILTLWLFFCASHQGVDLMPGIVLLWAIVPLCYYLFRYPSIRTGSTELATKSVLAPLYVCLPLSLLILIDRLPQGKMWVFFLLLVAFAGDTGAFYSGRLLGRHKLYPLISPGKTWEGAIGGVLSSVCAAFLYLPFSGLGRFDLSILALSVSIAVSGQIGDLAESMLKRNHGVKDSGTILPGHGGVLDRIDGLLFSIPILYICLTVMPPR